MNKVDSGLAPLVFGALAILVLTVGSGYALDLCVTKVLEETFSASMEAAMTVVVLAPIAWWFQRGANQRAHELSVLQELTRIRTGVQRAKFLLETHKSARTWTRQLRELITLLSDLRELRTALTSGPITDVDAAIDQLEELKTLYANQHAAVSKLSTQWGDILKVAPSTTSLLLSDETLLHKSLNSAINSIRSSLRG